MRALLLLESAVVILLAALIFWGGRTHAAAPLADWFPAESFLLDALPGEHVAYSVDGGRSTVEYFVDKVDRGNPASGPPKFSIRRGLLDAQRRPTLDPAPTYTHLPHLHGLFPLLAQDAPGGLDRTWVWTRITRDRIAWHGTSLRCWRVDAIDPALPDNASAVQVWMHEAVPVFGILKWSRGDHVYEADWAPKP
jgi:hypothetical protein